MDWYPWYLDLYDADAGHLTCLEDGAYRRLIDRYMRTRKPLPDDNAYLARVVGLTPDEWADIAPKIKPFFQAKNGKLHHKRCNLVLDDQDKRAKTLTERAKKGGIARQLKSRNNSAYGSQQAEPQADDKQATSNQQGKLESATATKTATKTEEENSAAESVSLPRAPATLPPEDAALRSAPGLEEKLRALDAIFPGAGANITNLSRFSDWELWGYDWKLDVLPTMRGKAATNGAGWMPVKLIYFDKPIAERHHARIAGQAPPSGQRGVNQRHRTPEETAAILAEVRAEYDAEKAEAERAKGNAKR
jgi:uncharacterized protein YdaU (DUF1376 family)